MSSSKNFLLAYASGIPKNLEGPGANEVEGMLESYGLIS